MSDLDQLTQIISGIMTGSNETIKENEAILKRLRETNINEYIITFANLMLRKIFH